MILLGWYVDNTVRSEQINVFDKAKLSLSPIAKNKGNLIDNKPGGAMQKSEVNKQTFRSLEWWSGLVWSGLVWSGLVWSGLVYAVYAGIQLVRLWRSHFLWKEKTSSKTEPQNITIVADD